MPAARPSACSGCTWLWLDGDAAMTTTIVLPPSAEGSGSEPTDARACGSRPQSALRESSLSLELREAGGLFLAPFFGSSVDFEAGRSDGGEQGVGEEGEGYLPIPSVPAPDLVVGQPHFSLRLLEAPLNSPAHAHARDLSQPFERGVLGGEDRV